VSKAIMTTASGRIIDFENPGDLDVCEHDIFHAHSNICRYNGTRRVMLLEHDALVTILVRNLGAVYSDFNPWPHPGIRVEGLVAMHDFVEYIVGDVVTGLKQMLPAYQVIEAAFSNRLWDHFGYRYPTLEEQACIDFIDHRALVVETHVTCHPVAARVAERFGPATTRELELWFEVQALTQQQQWEYTMAAVREGAGCS